MRGYEPAEIAALQAGRAVARDLVWIVAKHGDTGEPVAHGFYNGIRDASIDVRDPFTGGDVSRSFRGRGALLSVGAIDYAANIAVRRVEVQLSPIDSAVETLIKFHKIRHAPAQIFRVLLDPVTMAQVAAAKARHIGYVDTAPDTVPAEGGPAAVTLSIVSTTRELTRSNPDVRSHESQLARSGGDDDFFIDAETVGDWDIAWGRARGPVTGARTPQKGRKP